MLLNLRGEDQVLLVNSCYLSPRLWSLSHHVLDHLVGFFLLKASQLSEKEVGFYPVLVASVLTGV